MPTFGYPLLFSNGLNSNTQIRRSTDMVYQRGGTYEIVLTGDTYFSSMTMDVDLFSDSEKVGRMNVIPYSITQTGSTYTYRFNVRPYDYMSNYVKAQHYTYYWMSDWYSTTEQINWENPYPNGISFYFNYGYKYFNGNVPVTEYTTSPGNPFFHFTDIPACLEDTSFVPSGFTNTGYKFTYVGGTFEMNEHLILPNFDQEVGTVIGTGMTINTLDVYRRYSPMSQFLMDYPTLPEQSETSRFLTDAPRIQYVQSEDNYVLYYLNGLTGDRQWIEADSVLFEFFDETNTRIQNFTQALKFSGTTDYQPTGYTETLQIYALPVGPMDIEMIFIDTLDWNDIAYYTVQLCYGGTDNTAIGQMGPISEQFYFYLDTNCLPEDTRVVWLNNRGGFDYYTFKSYRQDTKKIATQSYDSRYYATDLSAPDRDYGRSVKTFATDINQEIVLESDYLNLPTGNWLEQLFYSPQVYIMNKDYVSTIDRQDKIYKDMSPVQILSTSVDTITEKHKKLNKYRITLKTSDTFFVNKGF